MAGQSKNCNRIGLLAVLGAASVLWHTPPVQAESPYVVNWSRQHGTAVADINYGGVAVDGAGNVYISGHTDGSLGGPNAGSTDAFLVKYDSLGSLLWSRQIGTASEDASYGVAVDGSGNAYISGYTRGSLGGPNAGAGDAFLAKYDTSGALLWSRQIGTAAHEFNFGVSVDGSGNAYITGQTNGSLGGPSAGAQDAFLVKYDTSGALQWSRQIGTSGYDTSRSVAVDGSGNVYISGITAGSLGGPNAGIWDAFLVKYDSSGSLLWSQQIGTASIDESHGVAVDGAGNVYISGGTQGSLGGASAGNNDAFLTKYNSSGTLLWSRQIGTASPDRSYHVSLDGSGNAYITGQTEGSLGGPYAGFGDSFLTKYDASGTLLWSRQIGTTSEDGSYGVAVDGSGNVYISGQTVGSLGGPNAGGYDAFLVKFSPPAEIPEPASLGLLCLGGVMLLRRRR